MMTKKERLKKRVLELIAAYANSANLLYFGDNAHQSLMSSGNLTSAERLIEIYNKLRYMEPKEVYLEFDRRNNDSTADEFCEIFEDIYGSRE